MLLVYGRVNIQNIAGMAWLESDVILEYGGWALSITT
jgi:hypothetical protein